MSDQLLSSHWYRLADVKLSLRSHVRVHQHRYRETTWYVVCDETTGKHHRFNEAAHNFIRLIDGQRSVNDIWEKLRDDLGDDAPTQDETIRLLGTLHFANNLMADITPDVEDLIDRRKQERKKRLVTRFGNPMSLRFPLLDPDVFLHKLMPFVAPLFTRFTGFVVAFVILLAALQMVINWDQLSNHAVENSFSPYNLFLMWLVYPVVKALHELGHGFAVKRWGGEVHEMGIMLLVLMPVPYVDASSATSLRSKYKRMMVGAAGIVVELFLASVALLIWLNIQQGLISDILFNVMLIGGASTLLFNGNPLLKFDGYFVLSDAIEIPGLAQRSNKYILYLVQKYIFTVPGLESPVMAKGESTWFIAYGVSAFIYKLFLMVVITLFVANQYFFIGVLLAFWVIFLQLVLPLIKMTSYLLASPMLMHKRQRAIGITASSIAVIMVFIFIVPVPHNTVTQGVVWLPEKSYVRASADGFVTSVLVKQGDRVNSDAPLIITDDPLMKARLKLLEAQYREYEIKHASLINQDIVQADIMMDELRLTKGKLERLQEQISELVMKSPADGEFITTNTSELEGYFVKQGDPVAYVLDYDDISIRVVVPQNDIGQVRQYVEAVEVRFVDDIETIHHTRISREIPAATYQLPSKALAQGGGGDIQVDPFDDSGLKSKEQYFQFDVAIPDLALSKLIGQRVYVKIKHGKESIALQLYRSIEELFLDEFGKA